MRAWTALFAMSLVSRLSYANPCSTEPSEWTGTYVPSVKGNTVTIQVTWEVHSNPPCAFGNPGCTDYLREQEDNSEIVKVQGQAYVWYPKVGQVYLCGIIDECVAPGTYRYGRKSPFYCGQPYYAEVTVTAPLSSSCARNVAAPEPYSGEAPWTGKGPTVECSSGCSMTSRGPVSCFVLGLDLLVLGVSLLALRLRRSRLHRIGLCPSRSSSADPGDPHLRE
jgi:hypothetical protein